MVGLDWAKTAIKKVISLDEILEWMINKKEDLEIKVFLNPL